MTIITAVPWTVNSLVILPYTIFNTDGGKKIPQPTLYYSWPTPTCNMIAQASESLCPETTMPFLDGFTRSGPTSTVICPQAIISAMTSIVPPPISAHLDTADVIIGMVPVPEMNLTEGDDHAALEGAKLATATLPVCTTSKDITVKGFSVTGGKSLTIWTSVCAITATMGVSPYDIQGEDGEMPGDYDSCAFTNGTKVSPDDDQDQDGTVIDFCLSGNETVVSPDVDQGQDGVMEDFCAAPPPITIIPIDDDFCLPGSNQITIIPLNETTTMSSMMPKPTCLTGIFGKNGSCCADPVVGPDGSCFKTVRAVQPTSLVNLANAATSRLP
ncbi:hypothetical protein LTR95_014644 [Oleoguttula sp. CCFEE 5521]